MLPRWLLTLTCVALLLAGSPAGAEVSGGVVKQSLGRDFGIFTGDMIQHEFIVQLPGGYQISEASLPAAGDLNYWLTLQDIELKKLDNNEDHQFFQLTLKYQTFYAPLDVRRLEIPAQSLRAHTKGEDEISITLPSWQFTMSPVKEIAQRGVGNNETAATFMKPALPPAYRATQRHENLLAGLSVSAAFIALLWAYLHGGLWRRQQSPFQQANRKIKRLQAKGNDDASACFAAIELIHRAFNQTAGYALFSRELPVFLENHPDFARHASEIEDFFRQSDAVVFGQHSEMMPSLKTLRQLSHRLSRAETLKSHKP